MGRKSDYTQEFQDNAVKLVVADGLGYALAARQLGVTWRIIWQVFWRIVWQKMANYLAIYIFAAPVTVASIRQ
jgi:transposase-like protein